MGEYEKGRFIPPTIRGFLQFGSPADAMSVYEVMKKCPDPPEHLPFRNKVKQDFEEIFLDQHAYGRSSGGDFRIAMRIYKRCYIKYDHWERSGSLEAHEQWPFCSRLKHNGLEVALDLTWYLNKKKLLLEAAGYEKQKPRFRTADPHEAAPTTYTMGR